LNPAGIPYLYASEDPDTAIAETRPWRDATVTLATLRVWKKLQLVDLRMTRKGRGDPASLLYWYAQMATRPVHQEDRHRYLFTQYLAEALKNDGHPGVIFASAQGQGHNLALFDPNCARVVSTALHIVHQVEYRSVAVSQAAEEPPS
jgi:hypothetical protein